MAYASRTSSSESGTLTATFDRLASVGRRALIPFLAAGYPSPAKTGELLDRLEEAGADVIELGVPFSDPLADGPTIQRASFAAIEQGASLEWALEQVADFRARSRTPVVVFSYLNPVLRYGPERFIADATSAGAQGALIADLPLGGDPALEEAIEDSVLDLIRLLTPTSGPDRVGAIAQRAQGFIYYVSRTGVTGASTKLRETLEEEIARIRQHTDVPVAIGFGVSTPEQARRAAEAADGVIVGSALIDALDEGGPEEFERLARSLREAIG